MSARIAKRLDNFDSSKIRQAFDLTTKLAAPIDLSIGFPEENTPPNIKTAGIRAIQDNHTRYLPTNGLPELRQKIGLKLSSQNGIDTKADNVTVTPGLTMAVLLCYLAILDPGDEILVPEPYFPPYKELAVMLGAKVISINTFPAFRLEPELIERSITARTKAIIINSPNNPTGTVYSKEDLSTIAAIAKKHKLIIISDEIYEHFCYDRPPFSIGSIYPDTLTLNGFSKAYAMTGWRIGYINGPADIIETINELQQYSVFSSSSIAQYAALKALDYSPDVRRKYKAKRNLAKKYLAPEFSEIYGAEGAFYLFLQLPDGVKDEDFVGRLAAEGVVVVAGSAFSSRDDYIRVSFAAKPAELKRGLGIIRELASSFQNEFVS